MEVSPFSENSVVGVLLLILIVYNVAWLHLTSCFLVGFGHFLPLSPLVYGFPFRVSFLN